MADVDTENKGQMEFLKALGFAKLITEGCDAIDMPVPALLKLLETKVGAKYPSVKGFEAKALAEPGHYDIVQFAKVKPNYTEGEDNEQKGKKKNPFDPSKVVIRTSKKGYKLFSGNGDFGWEHIRKGHIIGKGGKTMFPKGVSEDKIKQLVLEACDLGSEISTQKDKIKIIYRLSPTKYGISEMEVYINRAEKFIETAYPTKGSSVWIKPSEVLP